MLAICEFEKHFADKSDTKRVFMFCNFAFLKSLTI